MHTLKLNVVWSSENPACHFLIRDKNVNFKVYSFDMYQNLAIKTELNYNGDAGADGKGVYKSKPYSSNYPSMNTQ